VVIITIRTRPESHGHSGTLMVIFGLPWCPIGVDQVPDQFKLSLFFGLFLKKMLVGRYSCALTVITVSKSGKWVG